eukprot:sb/3479459/
MQRGNQRQPPQPLLHKNSNPPWRTYQGRSQSTPKSSRDDAIDVQSTLSAVSLVPAASPLEHPSPFPGLPPLDTSSIPPVLPATSSIPPDLPPTPVMDSVTTTPIPTTTKPQGGTTNNLVPYTSPILKSFCGIWGSEPHNTDEKKPDQNPEFASQSDSPVLYVSGGNKGKNQSRSGRSDRSIKLTDIEQARHELLLACETTADLESLPPPFYWKVRNNIAGRQGRGNFVTKEAFGPILENPGDAQNVFISCTICPDRLNKVPIPVKSRHQGFRLGTWSSTIQRLSRHASKEISKHMDMARLIEDNQRYEEKEDQEGESSEMTQEGESRNTGSDTTQENIIPELIDLSNDPTGEDQDNDPVNSPSAPVNSPTASLDPAAVPLSPSVNPPAVAVPAVNPPAASAVNPPVPSAVNSNGPVNPPDPAVNPPVTSPVITANSPSAVNPAPATSPVNPPLIKIEDDDIQILDLKTEPIVVPIVNLTEPNQGESRVHKATKMLPARKSTATSKRIGFCNGIRKAARKSAPIAARKSAPKAARKSAPKAARKSAPKAARKRCPTCYYNKDPTCCHPTSESDSSSESDPSSSLSDSSPDKTSPPATGRLLNGASALMAQNSTLQQPTGIPRAARKSAPISTTPSETRPQSLQSDITDSSSQENLGLHQPSSNRKEVCGPCQTAPLKGDIELLVRSSLNCSTQLGDVNKAVGDVRQDVVDLRREVKEVRQELGDEVRQIASAQGGRLNAVMDGICGEIMCQKREILEKVENEIGSLRRDTLGAINELRDLIFSMNQATEVSTNKVFTSVEQQTEVAEVVSTEVQTDQILNRTTIGTQSNSTAMVEAGTQSESTMVEAGTQSESNMLASTLQQSESTEVASTLQQTEDHSTPLSRTGTQVETVVMATTTSSSVQTERVTVLSVNLDSESDSSLPPGSDSELEGGETCGESRRETGGKKVQPLTGKKRKIGRPSNSNNKKSKVDIPSPLGILNIMVDSPSPLGSILVEDAVEHVMGTVESVTDETDILYCPSDVENTDSSSCSSLVSSCEEELTVVKALPSGSVVKVIPLNTGTVVPLNDVITKNETKNLEDPSKIEQPDPLLQHPSQIDNVSLLQHPSQDNVSLLEQQIPIDDVSLLQHPSQIPQDDVSSSDVEVLGSEPDDECDTGDDGEAVYNNVRGDTTVYDNKSGFIIRDPLPVSKDVPVNNSPKVAEVDSTIDATPNQPTATPNMSNQPTCTTISNMSNQATAKSNMSNQATNSLTAVPNQADPSSHKVILLPTSSHEAKLLPNSSHHKADAASYFGEYDPWKYDWSLKDEMIRSYSDLPLTKFLRTVFLAYFKNGEWATRTLAYKTNRHVTSSHQFLDRTITDSLIVAERAGFNVSTDIASYVIYSLIKAH